MYIFDASSIVNLVKKGVVKVFADGVTLDLTLYEVLNVIWKEYILLNRIDEATAREFIEILSDVFDVVKVVSIKGFEDEVFTLAYKEDLTVYDASYLYVAMRNNLALVTDDKKLMNKASKYVKIFSSTTLT